MDQKTYVYLLSKMTELTLLFSLTPFCALKKQLVISREFFLDCLKTVKACSGGDGKQKIEESPFLAVLSTLASEYCVKGPRFLTQGRYTYV